MKLIQGDCLVEMQNIPDGSVDLILTDPPYGTTACKWDSVIPFEPMWKQLNRIIKDNGAIILTAAQPFTSALIMSNPNMFKYDLIYEKTLGSGFLNAKRMPMRYHEEILVFYKNLPTYNPIMGFGVNKKGINRAVDNGDNYGKRTKFNQTYNDKGRRYPKSVITFSTGNRTRGQFHPTQKPVALMEYLIKTYTNENETVLDFTMGSGTTGVACKNLNRNFIGIELDETYFEIAKKRIENHIVQTELFKEEK